MTTETSKTGVPPTPPVPPITPTAVVAPVLAPAVVPLSHAEKPDKFNGTEFKRWQMKMLFYLTTLRLARYLSEDAPIIAENETDAQVRIAHDEWKNSDFLCRNYILNGLDNALYNVYCTVKTAKELWLTLEKKYVAEDAGLKKFVVGRFLDFKMVDSKSVLGQVEELQVLLPEIHTEGMILSESFQVATIIWKLPPLWKDFKKQMKHKRKEMTMEDLLLRLRMEEQTLNLEKRTVNQFAAKANMVEKIGKASKWKKSNKRKNSGKGIDLGPRGGLGKKARFDGRCFVCDKQGHRASNCQSKKGNSNKKPAEANLGAMECLSDGVSELSLSD